jgi:hypothetical protein
MKRFKSMASGLEGGWVWRGYAVVAHAALPALILFAKKFQKTLSGQGLGAMADGGELSLIMIKSNRFAVFDDF